MDGKTLKAGAIANEALFRVMVALETRGLLSLPFAPIEREEGPGILCSGWSMDPERGKSLRVTIRQAPGCDEMELGVKLPWRIEPTLAMVELPHQEWSRWTLEALSPYLEAAVSALVVAIDHSRLPSLPSGKTWGTVEEVAFAESLARSNARGFLNYAHLVLCNCRRWDATVDVQTVKDKVQVLRNQMRRRQVAA